MSISDTIQTVYHNTPLWIVILTANKQHILWCSFVGELSSKKTYGDTYMHLTTAIKQLDEYFDWSRKNFNLPVLFTWTSFQQSVRESLLKIPYWETMTY